MLLDRDDCLVLHKVEGFSMNQLNALKALLESYIEGISVMQDKWRSVKGELGVQLGVTSTENGWRLDISKAVQYMLDLIQHKLKKKSTREGGCVFEFS